MEDAAPLIENNEGWNCGFHCRVGSAACAKAMRVLGSGELDVDDINQAQSTIMAYNNCQGPTFDEKSTDYICTVADVSVEAAEVWV